MRNSLIKCATFDRSEYEYVRAVADLGLNALSIPLALQSNAKGPYCSASARYVSLPGFSRLPLTLSVPPSPDAGLFPNPRKRISL